MLLDFATNARGTTYTYLVCFDRPSKKTTCTRRAVPVKVTERLVADSYASITISEDDYRHLAAKVGAAFDERGAGREQAFADLTANRARQYAQSDKLLAARFSDAIALSALKRHRDRIRPELADIELRLWEHDLQHVDRQVFLHDSLRLSSHLRPLQRWEREAGVIHSPGDYRGGAATLATRRGIRGSSSRCRRKQGSQMG